MSSRGGNSNRSKAKKPPTTKGQEADGSGTSTVAITSTVASTASTIPSSTSATVGIATSSSSASLASTTEGSVASSTSTVATSTTAATETTTGLVSSTTPAVNVDPVGSNSGGGGNGGTAKSAPPAPWLCRCGIDVKDDIMCSRCFTSYYQRPLHAQDIAEAKNPWKSTWQCYNTTCQTQNDINQPFCTSCNNAKPWHPHVWWCSACKQLRLKDWPSCPECQQQQGHGRDAEEELDSGDEPFDDGLHNVTSGRSLSSTAGYAARRQGGGSSSSRGQPFEVVGGHGYGGDVTSARVNTHVSGGQHQSRRSGGAHQASGGHHFDLTQVASAGVGGSLLGGGARAQQQGQGLLSGTVAIGTKLSTASALGAQSQLQSAGGSSTSSSSSGSQRSCGGAQLEGSSSPPGRLKPSETKITEESVLRQVAVAREGLLCLKNLVHCLEAALPPHKQDLKREDTFEQVGMRLGELISVFELIVTSMKKEIVPTGTISRAYVAKLVEMGQFVEWHQAPDGVEYTIPSLSFTWNEKMMMAMRKFYEKALVSTPVGGAHATSSSTSGTGGGATSSFGSSSSATAAAEAAEQNIQRLYLTPHVLTTPMTQHQIIYHKPLDKYTCLIQLTSSLPCESDHKPAKHPPGTAVQELLASCCFKKSTATCISGPSLWHVGHMVQQHPAARRAFLPFFGNTAWPSKSNTTVEAKKILCSHVGKQSRNKPGERPTQLYGVAMEGENEIVVNNEVWANMIRFQVEDDQQHGRLFLMPNIPFASPRVLAHPSLAEVVKTIMSGGVLPVPDRELTEKGAAVKSAYLKWYEPPEVSGSSSGEEEDDPNDASYRPSSSTRTTRSSPATSTTAGSSRNSKRRRRHRSRQSSRHSPHRTVRSRMALMTSPEPIFNVDPLPPLVRSAAASHGDSEWPTSAELGAQSSSSLHDDLQRNAAIGDEQRVAMARKSFDERARLISARAAAATPSSYSASTLSSPLYQQRSIARIDSTTMATRSSIAHHAASSSSSQHYHDEDHDRSPAFPPITSSTLLVLKEYGINRWDDLAGEVLHQVKLAVKHGDPTHQAERVRQVLLNHGMEPVLPTSG